LEILEGRLEYLYDTVDYFVIVETNITHSGAKKPLNYLENIARYHKYSDKILYFPFSTDASEFNFGLRPSECDFKAPQWQMENAQRNHIAQALALFDTDAVVMISDVDEIPNRDMLQLAIDNLNPSQTALAFIQDMFYYNFNQKQQAPWPGTVITTNNIAREFSPQKIREARWTLPGVANGGWHLSYWGTPEKIKIKLENFAHQEFNSSNFTDVNKIAGRIRAGTDLFDRGDGYQFVPVDRSLLPADLLGVFEKYEITNVTTVHKSKNLVLGLALRYGVNEIKNFILSFRENNQHDCMHLILDQATLDKTQDFLKSQNIDFTIFENYDSINTCVNNVRYEYYRRIITSGNYKNIFLSDVSDVIFQQDPFINLPEQYIYFFQEDSGFSIGTESFNTMWMKLVYGNQIFEQVKHQSIICGGTVLGSSVEILEYVDMTIHELNLIRTQSPDIWKHHVLDQTPSIYLCYVREEKIQGLQIKKNGDIVGTIGLSISQHDAADRVMRQGNVITVNNMASAVIHQYNRHADLMEFVNQKYKVTHA
jgi:beta-1,4-mannosyl-glycoprotein beta-1,4-N-acetylglucosaminyltransferase